MKHELHDILFSTVKNFELAESLRRHDPCFDAFAFLAQLIGHKNQSTLRKMCRPREQANGAKLGFEDALTIMRVTADYRLLQFMTSWLREQRADKNQHDLFSTPLTSIADAVIGEDGEI